MMLMHCRNPFLYSGHFNFRDKEYQSKLRYFVAIPSFIQGISTFFSV